MQKLNFVLGLAQLSHVHNIYLYIAILTYLAQFSISISPENVRKPKFF